MIASRHIASLVLGAGVLLAVGCNGTPVGRICDLGSNMPEPGSTIIASPSLDCVSRACLEIPLGRALPTGSMYPQGNNGLCTAECEADSDCDRVPESPCVTGFTCGIAISAPGPFCCQKFCICKDYVVVPDTGEIPPPAACDATNPDNTCCNLAGRNDNAMYPLCKT